MMDIFGYNAGLIREVTGSSEVCFVSRTQTEYGVFPRMLIVIIKSTVTHKISRVSKKT